MRRILLAVAVTLSGCNGFVGEWTVLDGFGSRFGGIRNGQTRQEVVTALGSPAREGHELTLPQREGYEATVEAATQSRASTFVYWDTGVDEVAVIGLSDAGRVVFKCRTGT